MDLTSVELFVDDHRLVLAGMHETYLDGIAGAQYGATPLTHFVKRLPEGATYLDVGANKP